MAFDALRRQRVLRRYRLMFKVSLTEVAVSLLMIVAGIGVAIDTSKTTMIGWGLILFILGVLTSYKILNSTVRLLEHEARDVGWDNLV